MKTIIGWFIDKYQEWKHKKNIKKKIKMMQKNDPFTYNH